MLKIGVLVPGGDMQDDAIIVARTILPYLKNIGKRAYGTSFELLDLTKLCLPIKNEWELTDEGAEKIEEKDGFIFIVPTFSYVLPKDYLTFFQNAFKEIKNKTLMIACFGDQEAKWHTISTLKRSLLEYNLALPATDIFIPNYSVVEWEFKYEVEKLVTEPINDFLMWAMSTKYLRNLKKSLVI